LVYFRGHDITVERLNDLETKYGLYTKAEKIVLSGESAGGLATLMWTNYVAEKVKKGKVWSLADASIFYDPDQPQAGIASLKQQFKTMMNITNT
jgi:hypothetical protein